MIKISACVITKNEEKNIVRWIENVKHFADEILVVDTGSEDKTVENAIRSGANVKHFQWINDFAAAKNFAIDNAHGDWIVFLDADEFFSPITVKKVRSVLESYHTNKNVVGFICRLNNIDEDDNNAYQGSITQIRIFRRIESIRYVGKIHEKLVNRDDKLKEMKFTTELEIYHTGYSKNIVRKKIERNFELLQKEIEKRGESISDYYPLMDCYFGFQDYENAEKYARKLIDEKVIIMGNEKRPYTVIASIMMFRDEAPEKIIDFLEEAKEKYPKDSNFVFMEALVHYWGRKNYLLAEKKILEGLKLFEKEEENFKNTGIVSDARRFIPKVCVCMACISRMRFQKKETFEWIVKGINSFCYYEPLFSVFWEEIEDLSDVEKIESINAVYPNEKKVAEFLAKQLEGKNAGKVYLYYARRAQWQNDIADFKAIGRYDALSAAIVTRLERIESYAIYASKRENILAESKLVPILSDKLKKRWLKVRTEDLPLVSIMIPTYNRPEFFEKTLKSALSQTYENIEIIVCDSSTDERTANIIEKYMEDKRVSYYRNREAKTKKENFVPFEKLAHGEFLQWCMDDDILYPEKLEKMVDILIDNPKVTLVSSLRNVIDKEGEIVRKVYCDFELKETIGYYYGKEIGSFLLKSGANFIGEPSAVLFRRSDLKNHYWHADCRGYKTISDIVMWLELFEKGDCVIFREALSAFRVHKEQEGASADVILTSRLEWYELITEYFNRKVFIEEKEDYITCLQRLYNEWSENDKNICAIGTEKMRVQYGDCMKKIGAMLNEML